ncbi:GNAT family N-acetyltransferase [Allobranchiibius sp. CTAmp26]|uniref:GNAT family N-acetyltransferase n=1 Tax=Allobranchiibius sp. CTAmp26 TaxID=2815214 RepID=UPI001AA12747|nr:GNAT family N-acetyltransferase [Allobranchiibius sp. CTAmp26]MBO1756572.1 GNAT family N-acetyltransferase [Allobranchiibius sp. CTAmp26]
MLVTTTTLQSTARPSAHTVELPPDARIERVGAAMPEFARWLYAAVGGPWRWTDRLGWTRGQWTEDLARPGTELHVLYVDGAPAGYAQFAAVVEESHTAVEIVYFGLMVHVTGRGLGRALLAYAIEAGWSLPERHALPAAGRVWLHTCDLDGPHALANYRARGFEVVAQTTAEEVRPSEPLGAWVSAGGPA